MVLRIAPSGPGGKRLVLTDADMLLIRRMAGEGRTRDEIQKALGISRPTWHRLSKDHPEMLRMLKEGYTECGYSGTSGYRRGAGHVSKKPCAEFWPDIAPGVPDPRWREILEVGKQAARDMLAYKRRWEAARAELIAEDPELKELLG